MNNRLMALYQNTIYQCQLGQHIFRLKANEICPGNLPFKTLAIITADNPFSSNYPERINAPRRKRLAFLLKRMAITYGDSLALDESGHWPDEKGYCCVINNPADACKIARLFGQNAIVVAHPGEPVFIQWCQNNGHINLYGHGQERSQ